MISGISGIRRIHGITSNRILHTVTHSQQQNNMFMLVPTICCAMIASVDGRTYKIGYISEVGTRDPLRGPAIDIAIATFKKNGWLQDHDFK